MQSWRARSFSSSTWSTGSGLFPYLLWQGSPSVVSGTTYSDHGTTAAGGMDVNILVNGTSAWSGTSGANGYFYEMLAPGTLALVATPIGNRVMVSG